MIPPALLEPLIIALLGVALFMGGYASGWHHEKLVSDSAALKAEQQAKAHYAAEANALDSINQQYLALQQVLIENTNILAGQASELAKLPQYQIKCFDSKGLGLANQALKGKK